MGSTKVFNSIQEAKDHIRKMVKKGYSGVHAGINWGGRKKYYVSTIGKPKKGRRSVITNKLKKVSNKVFRRK